MNTLGSFTESAHNHMQRTVMDKVLGRGRSGVAHEQGLRARALNRRRAGADVGR